METTVVTSDFNTVQSIVIVDDNDTDIFIHQQVLKVCGYHNKIHTYTKAKDALAFLQECKGSAIPDILFLDIYMKEMDGFKFLEEYEKLPEEILKKCKVVALSTSNDQRFVNAILQTEYVSHYLVKPLLEEKFLELLSLINKSI